MIQGEKDHPSVVDPAWLHDWMGGISPPASRGENLLIIEVGWQEEENYRAGHIPAQSAWIPTPSSDFVMGAAGPTLELC
jgi:hypothetical protein